MDQSKSCDTAPGDLNQGKVVGQEPPPELKEICAIRMRLQM